MYRSQTAIANDLDYDKTFTAEYTGDASGATLITPTSGKVLKIAGVYISTASADGDVRVYFSDDENDQINTVLTAFGADTNNYVPLLMRGDRNAVLKVDSTLGDGDGYFILVNFSEE